MSKPFDPRQHVRQLDNGAPYLDVKWRLHWLRSEHPEAEIETELLSVDEESAVCKATVRIPGGGTATGHASANRGNNPSYIETAETRAIGRALAALGYGAEFVDDDLIASRPGPPPVSLVPSQPRQPSRPAPGALDRSEPAELPTRPERLDRSERPERPMPEPAVAAHQDDDVDDTSDPPVSPGMSGPSPVRSIRRQERDDESLAEAPRREPRQPREIRETVEVRERSPAPPRDATPQTPEEVIGELPTPLSRGSDIRTRQNAQPRGNTPQAREDVNWNKFWEWAKRRGYRDAQHLKDLLDIDVNAHTPGEVRDVIRRYEQKNPPDQN